MAPVRSYQIKGCVPILVAFFIAFTIGLNLGLHGVLDQTKHIIKSHQILRPEIVEIAPNVAPIDETHKTVIRDDGKVKENSIIAVIVPKPATLEGGAPALTHTEDVKSIPASVETKLKIVREAVTIYSGTVLVDIKNKQPQLVHTGVSKDIPIVLLTCNRPVLLRNTLDSLMKVRGIKKKNIIISQDGALAEVAEIAKQAGLTLIQNLEGLRLRGGAAQDGASRIAMHYKYSLSSVFDSHREADAVIVIEDDLLFSPDMYEYLISVAPILDADPTAFVVSAWSDNGFKDKVKDPFALRRTDYFPGLGWLLTRRLYKEELEPKWPQSHWDHWLRSPETSKHRDIIYPQVPRTYHNGIKGTFMNLETHNKYFRDIGYNTDSSVVWPSTDGSGGGAVDGAAESTIVPLYMQGHQSVNQYRVEQLVKSCRHVTSVMDLLKYQDEIICLWVDINTNCEGHPVAFEPVAAFFGLWHEHRRGNHRGLHEFYFNSNYLLLLNVFDDQFSGSANGGKHTYRYIMPNEVRPLQNTKQFDKALLADIKRKTMNIKMVKATELGQNCNQVCQAAGQSCSLEQLPVINTCGALQEAFPCVTCRHSFGTEQPAYVDPQADEKFGPGECLVNSGSEASTCEASHPSTYRLCACK